MALQVQINGTNRNGYVRSERIEIDKDGSMETARLEIVDGANVFLPVEGDAIRITQPGGALEFGGEVYTAKNTALDRGKRGAIVAVTARGWAFEARDVKVWASFPSQGVYTTAQAVLSTYMTAKGWVNIGPTSGGPVAPARRYDGVTVGDVLDDLQEWAIVPWRVNGDRQFAYTPIGSLVAPTDYVEGDGSVVLLDPAVERSRARRATRLFVSTGGSASYLEHAESFTLNGGTTHVPVNVLPSRATASTSSAYAAGATSVALRGLPKSYTLKAGATFDFATHGGYVLASDVTTDGEGNATVALTAGLSVAVTDGDAVVFDAGALVRLEVNGTPTALTGPWTFDTDQAAFVKSGALAPFGTVITYRARINLPAVVRVWSASTRTFAGQWNYTNVRDADVSTDLADLATVIAWATGELDRRGNTPKTLTIRTFSQGAYPWQRATVSIPSRGAVGDYLIQRTRIVDVGARNPEVTLTMLEGDAIGPDWAAYLRNQVRGLSGSSGSITSLGSGSAPAPIIIGGSGVLPAGLPIPLGGDNKATVLASTTRQDVEQAIPVTLGGAGMAGNWQLRAPVYQLSVGTVVVELWDQTTGSVLASVTTTATGTHIDNAFFAYPTATFAAPADVHDLLLMVRTTSGTREVVVGKATIVKL